MRLGRGAFSTGTLHVESIDNAVVAFQRFRELFDRHGVSVYRAVATSAVRSSDNRERLIDRLFREAGIELEVIDGAEEGRLVRKAVLGQFGKRRQPDMILDLGGGSLEVMRRVGRDWESGSAKIGTVRLLDTFGLRGPISDDERRMVRRFSRATLRLSIDEGIRQVGAAKTAVLCGGNAEFLAGLLGEQDKLGMAYLPLDSLRKELGHITALDVKERMATYDVRRDRAEVMGAAAIIIAAVGKELGLGGFLVPGVGIRDGVVLDLAEASVGKLGSDAEVPILAAARAFADRLGHTTRHAEQVRMIAERLFDELTSLHKLPRRCCTALQLAALLHDLGEVIHRKSHHKHSEYLIMQGRIPGLASPLREMVAATARAHRKSLPSKRKHEIYSGLEPKEQSEVQKMAILLRLANALDASRRNQVVALSAEIRGDRVLLSISSHGGALAAARLDSHCLEFEELFGIRLEIACKEVSGEATVLSTKLAN